MAETRPLLVRLVLISAASSILSGYDQGVIAGAIGRVKADLHLTHVQEELFVGVLNLVAAFGCLIAGAVADTLGRRWTICLANWLFIVGSIFLSTANSFGLLLVGRVVMGLGVGIALVVAPVFTAECAPTRLRGFLVTLSDFATNLGIVGGYAVGLAFYHTNAGWRYMFALGIVPSVCVAAFVWALPDSPRWLVMCGEKDAALAAVRRIGAVKDAEAEVEQILRIQEETLEGSAGWRGLFNPADAPTRRMLVAGLGVAFFSQACGTEAVVYYIPDIMTGLGLDEYHALVATLGAGGCKLLFLVIAAFLFDRVGRRSMLFVSGTGMALSFVLLSTSHALNSSALTVIGVCAVMSSFSLGFSPLVYVIGTEVFPTRVRSVAMAFSLFLTRLIAGIIASLFLSLQQAMGHVALWAVFATVAAIAVVFAYFCVPETKGLSLEEVASQFGDSSEKSRRSHASSATKPLSTWNCLCQLAYGDSALPLVADSKL
ncbi:hypothetical protein AB1Y20_005942 [Prymnesium parvum]|uniref:Major facilitator superfamily (MFS) profile domain-containing protein n=1 Tax=Prymnesium parvum TaxID=97485 RepID=A0AB34J161_PRYPA